MAVLKEANIMPLSDESENSFIPGSVASGWSVMNSYTFVPEAIYIIDARYSEVDLSEFMNKLLEIEQAMDSYTRGEIVVEDETPSAGYFTMKYYTDEATPILLSTFIVNKSTGSRTQAS
jgi:hypothetical protein